MQFSCKLDPYSFKYSEHKEAIYAGKFAFQRTPLRPQEISLLYRRGSPGDEHCSSKIHPVLGMPAPRLLSGRLSLLPRLPGSLREIPAAERIRAARSGKRLYRVVLYRVRRERPARHALSGAPPPTMPSWSIASRAQSGTSLSTCAGVPRPLASMRSFNWARSAGARSTYPVASLMASWCSRRLPWWSTR